MPRHYKTKKPLKKPNNEIRVINVRNPFERLHSAYSDKLNLKSAFFNWRDSSHNENDPVKYVFEAVKLLDMKDGFTIPKGYFSSFEAFIRVDFDLSFNPNVIFSTLQYPTRKLKMVTGETSSGIVNRVK